MLVIRQEQFEILGQRGAAALEDKLLSHLQAHWPDTVATLGLDSARLHIRDSIASARDYGLETVYDVTRYLNLAQALGPHFDADPRYPWAQAFLNESSWDATDKMDRLCTLAAETFAARPAHV
ncbi:hypothetical protein RugamoR57_07360 [Duganella caerulea]|uniref:hypothetical protein n=1 Tax=Duganella caerulea TaxID=2885762 RepID=UPI0030E9405A